MSGSGRRDEGDAAWGRVDRLVKEHGATLDIHGEQPVLWIDMLLVPKRGKGVGSKIVEAIAQAAKLSGYEKIRLFAADTEGAGRSNDFWERMGFEYDYDEKQGDDTDWEMHMDLIE